MHVLFYLGAFCLKQKGEKKERKRNKSHENNEMIKKEGIEQKRRVNYRRHKKDS